MVALWRHHLVGTWLGRGELELTLLVAMLVVAVVTRLQLVQVEVGGVEPVVVLQGPAAVARPNRVARETVSGGLQYWVAGYGAGRAGFSFVPENKFLCKSHLKFVMFIKDFQIFFESFVKTTFNFRANLC